MLTLRFLLIAPLVFASPVLAQGTQGINANQPHNGVVGSGSAASRTTVATQPSKNPFLNPIGQGVPPAASAGGAHNSNLTNVPR